jgi:hypothetical protein
MSSIRQIELNKGSNTIAIAITADVMQSQERSSMAGFAAILFKPLDITEVTDLLVRLIRQKEIIVG